MTPTERQMHAETLHVAISLMFANNSEGWQHICHRMSVEAAMYNRSDSRVVRHQARPITNQEMLDHSILVKVF